MMLTSVACFILLLHSGASLMCTRCMENCRSPVLEECLPVGMNQKVACLTEIYTKINGSAIYTDRKCVIFNKKIEFECVDYPNYRSLSCTVCYKNLCNAALPFVHRLNDI